MSDGSVMFVERFVSVANTDAPAQNYSVGSGSYFLSTIKFKLEEEYNYNPDLVAKILAAKSATPVFKSSNVDDIMDWLDRP